MTRDPFIDGLKGLLILLVVIGHAMQYGVYHGVGHWDDPFYKAIYLFHMPLFMAVSGFLSRRSILTKPPLRLAWQRFQAYIVPIFAWALIAQLSLLPFGADFSPAAFPRLVFREALASLWFLWCLYGATIATIILTRFGKGGPYLAAVGFTVLLFIPDFFHLYLFKYTLPFFWLGFLAARPGLAAWPRWRTPTVALASFALTILAFFAWREETYIYLDLRMSLVPENVSHILIRYAAGITGSLSALLALWFVYPHLPRFLKTPLSWFGRRSLPIYILQGYAFLWITRVATQLTPALHPASRIAFALTLGLLVATLTGFFGELLARRQFTARTLLGITGKPKSPTDSRQPPGGPECREHPPQPAS